MPSSEFPVARVCFTTSRCCSVGFLKYKHFLSVLLSAEKSMLEPLLLCVKKKKRRDAFNWPYVLHDDHLLQVCCPDCGWFYAEKSIELLWTVHRSLTGVPSHILECEHFCHFFRGSAIHLAQQPLPLMPPAMPYSQPIGSIPDGEWALSSSRCLLQHCRVSLCPVLMVQSFCTYTCVHGVFTNRIVSEVWIELSVHKRNYFWSRNRINEKIWCHSKSMAA